MNTDLLRQRRNLIAVSIVLLLFDFAQVKVGKVSVLGTELIVGNAPVIMLFAWVMWAYFLLRYYQYWRAKDDKSVRSSYHGRYNALVDREGRRVKKAYPQLGQYPQTFIRRVGFLRYVWFPQGLSNVTEEQRMLDSVPMHAWKLVSWRVRAIVYVVLQTPHATDHVLPFILAIAAPAVSLISLWHKSA